MSLPRGFVIVPIRHQRAPPMPSRKSALSSLLQKLFPYTKKKSAKELQQSNDPTVSSLALELLSLIRPMDPVGKSFERIGNEFDGGYVQPVHDTVSKIAYSLGINRDVSWDMEMAKRGYRLFQYDHTIEKLPARHKHFNWEKKGICGSRTRQPQMISLEEAISGNGHGALNDLILKMDIESAEWDVFSEMDQAFLGKFDMIIGEFHRFHKLTDPAWFAKAKASLQKLARTHYVVHVHANNASPFEVHGGVPLPRLLELTWLRKDLCLFEPATRIFPTALDAPNIRNRAQHFLGRFSY
ncbi:hypothetical protein ACFSM5_00980 [Lacibacterium aquatile]|uniref:Methyltransferase FkbM domain-containing protein n=1 Tax=Lacibacterium aquatile TaxID=1168082 RepID=A0ABW5DPI2_9PROT